MKKPNLWRIEINKFSKTADIRTLVCNGDEIISADLPHYEADRIVTAHNKEIERLAEYEWMYKDLCK